MPREILLLEDDADRITRLTAVLRDLIPDTDLLVWRSAHRMAADLPTHLPRAILICLDHDLAPDPADPADPGDGLDVARALAALVPQCPVLIHTSNADRAPRMAGVLRDAGWSCRTIAPPGPDWIQTTWRRHARTCLG